MMDVIEETYLVIYWVLLLLINEELTTVLNWMNYFTGMELEFPKTR